MSALTTNESRRSPGAGRAPARRRGGGLAAYTGAIAILVFLALWQMTGFFLNPILLSTPVRVAVDWVQVAASGYLPLALLEGFREMLTGLLGGVVVGIVVGVLMGRYAVVDLALNPFVNFFASTPGIVIIPLVVVWVGITVAARTSLIFLITLWPVLINTAAGIRNVQRGWVDVGYAFGLSETQILRRITLPAAVPYIMAGVRISAGIAIIGMIVGEIEISFFGLGYMLSSYGASFETGHFFAVVITSSVFGIVNVALLKLMERRWFPWIAGAARAPR
jgi:ABC-type nitrate/sulfonate/bicarbonate transport system permease component